MAEDYENQVTIMGQHDGDLKIVAVDETGQLYSLMVGANGVVVAVDADGNMRTVMQGDYGGTLKTLKCDSAGNLLAQLMGMYGSTPVPISCDASGRLSFTALDQVSINPDGTEAATWDSPITTLLSNLDRIRYAITQLSGETWGTFTTSTATLWAKFHATTGHTHTGGAGNAPVLDHGGLDPTSLTHDDHVRYYDKDTSKPFTGSALERDVNDSYITLSGGTGYPDSMMTIYGKNHASFPGTMVWYILNAAKTSWVAVMSVAGATNTPYLDMRSHRIKSLADPTAAQDAATKNYVDTTVAFPAGIICMWKGSIATIPSGWYLCDGTNGTPNLRDKFIVGAGTTYNPADTGGAATHTLTEAEIPSHVHSSVDGAAAGASGSAVTTINSYTGRNTAATGGGGAHNNLPPYYALAYIMKA